MTLMNALACGSHISALWTPPVQNYLKYCIYAFPSLQGFAISNFLLDLLILVLPIPKVRIESDTGDLRLSGSDLVPACHNSPKTSCDWSVCFSNNVSDTPVVPLAMPHSTSKYLLLPVA